MEKKFYEVPQTKAVLVKTESLLATISFNGEDDAEAGSREGKSSWSDED